MNPKILPHRAPLKKFTPRDGLTPFFELPIYRVEDGSSLGGRGFFGVFTFLEKEFSACNMPSYDRETFYSATIATLANDPGFRTNFLDIENDEKSIQVPYELLVDASSRDFRGFFYYILGGFEFVQNNDFPRKRRKGRGKF